MASGTCGLCGCTEHAPCLGGLFFASSLQASHVHRLVADRHVLAPGRTCFWLDEGETLCSAHSADQLRAAGVGEPELVLQLFATAG